MAETQQNLQPDAAAPAFRIDQKLHQILYKEPARPKLEPKPEEVLPEPPYPQHPNPREMTKQEYQKLNAHSHVENMGCAILQIALASATNLRRSFRICSPNGNAISIAIIAGHTTTR